MIYYKEYLYWTGSQLDGGMRLLGRTWRQVQPHYSRSLRYNSSDAKVRARRARAFASGYNPSTDPAVLASGDTVISYFPVPGSSSSTTSSAPAGPFQLTPSATSPSSSQGTQSLVVKLRVHVPAANTNATAQQPHHPALRPEGPPRLSPPPSSPHRHQTLDRPPRLPHSPPRTSPPLPRLIELEGYEPVTVPPLPLVPTGRDDVWPVSDMRFTRVEGEVVRVRLTREEMPIMWTPRVPAGPRGLTQREIEEDFERWRKLGLL